MSSQRHLKMLAPRRREQGAILVTSLLLLLVLTIIGISVMQMTRMEERMSGNTRDISTAFQGAEAALRGGEAQVLTFVSRPSLCATAGTPCASAFSKTALPNVGEQDGDWWKASANTFSDPNIGEDFIEKPQFIIEQVAFVRNSPDVDDLTGRDFYQISAHSTGGSGKSEVIVQSTFARNAL